MHELTFTINEDFFNTIYLYHAPSRWEGNVEIARGRTVVVRRDGTIVRDETYDVGVRIIHPEPEPLTLWQRFLNWLP